MALLLIFFCVIFNLFVAIVCAPFWRFGCILHHFNPSVFTSFDVWYDDNSWYMRSMKWMTIFERYQGLNLSRDMILGDQWSPSICIGVELLGTCVDER